MSEILPLTIPADINRKVVGYIINSGFSAPAQRVVSDLQRQLDDCFPGALWASPADALHITLLDWLAPLVDYGDDKDELFERIRDEYTRTFREILEQQPPISVMFDTLEVHPTAIIIRGHDDGSYQRIREAFLDRIELLPGTKQPPAIIHSTICKFTAELPLEDVHAAAHALGPLDIVEEIKSFRLVREETVFMRKAETVMEFPLR